MKITPRRAAGFLTLCLCAMIVGAIVASHTMLVWSVAPTSGTVALNGLDQPTQITFDSLGIPQIWAQTEHDGYFALGYQHASDRLFQMDLTRRVAQGRLSEALGTAALELDTQQRRVGHGRIARAALNRVSDHDRARLQAYCDGVNAFARTCRAWPFEFYLLPITFEPWTIYDCLSLLSFQTWFSNALMNKDKFYLQLWERLGQDRATQFLDLYPDWAPVTVVEDNGTAALDDLAGSLRMSQASNAWAVAPTRSASGRAMLAADPHLEITRLPQFWYAAGLHISQNQTQVSGITVPGLPFMIMGHNGAAAWAFTVGGIDVNDYYLEQTDPEDSLQFLTPDGYRAFEIVVDTIVVSGHRQPELVQTKLSRHGPIVAANDSTGALYSLHWAGYDTDLAAAVGSGFGLASVSDFETFRRLVTTMGALDASWIYADSAGNIGYQLGTPVPLRSRSLACFPGRGWNRDDDWQGYLALDSTPHCLNPQRGWLASCNNKPDNSPDLIGVFAPARITRVSSLLQSVERMNQHDMAAFQQDRRDMSLLRWRQNLSAALDEIGEKSLADQVRLFNGECDTASRVAGLLEVFSRDWCNLTFASLGELAGSVSTSVLEQAVADSSCDSVSTANLRANAREAARRALAFCAGRSWGQIQSMSMRHPMAQIPVLSSLLGLSRGPWPWGGTAGTLDAAFSRQQDSSFEVIVAPSWRFVIDFGDIDGAAMTLPAGNSGNPMSEHFFDFFDRYRAGELWNVPFNHDAVYARARSVLTLSPQP